MKGISLTQPYATLVALREKRIETRGWRTSYRGEIAIAAAKKFPSEARGLCPTRPFSNALGSVALPTGMIVAVASLVECFQFDAGTEGRIRARSLIGRLPRFEADFGYYTAGRYGFVFDDVRALAEPVACKGALSLWDVPADVERVIRNQLAQAA
jgi:hypothetical protein